MKLVKVGWHEVRWKRWVVDPKHATICHKCFSTKAEQAGALSCKSKHCPSWIQQAKKKNMDHIKKGSWNFSLTFRISSGNIPVPVRRMHCSLFFLQGQYLCGPCSFVRNMINIILIYFCKQNILVLSNGFVLHSMLSHFVSLLRKCGLVWHVWSKSPHVSVAPFVRLRDCVEQISYYLTPPHIFMSNLTVCPPSV